MSSVEPVRRLRTRYARVVSGPLAATAAAAALGAAPAVRTVTSQPSPSIVTTCDLSRTRTTTASWEGLMRVTRVEFTWWGSGGSRLATTTAQGNTGGSDMRGTVAAATPQDAVTASSTAYLDNTEGVATGFTSAVVTCT